MKRLDDFQMTVSKAVSLGPKGLPDMMVLKWRVLRMAVALAASTAYDSLKGVEPMSKGS